MIYGYACASTDHQSLAAQVVWVQSNDGDREAEVPETMPPVVAAECVVLPFAPLPSGSRGNVIAAAGAAFLDMVAGRQASKLPRAEVTGAPIDLLNATRRAYSGRPSARFA